MSTKFGYTMVSRIILLANIYAFFEWPLYIWNSLLKLKEIQVIEIWCIKIGIVWNLHTDRIFPLCTLLLTHSCTQYRYCTLLIAPRYWEVKQTWKCKVHIIQRHTRLSADLIMAKVVKLRLRLMVFLITRQIDLSSKRFLAVWTGNGGSIW
jgi:hypothetical protein